MNDIRIVGWKRWQGPGVYDVSRRRKPGSKRPLKLAFVSVAAEFHDDPEQTPGQGSFEQFAAALGAGANAEGWWVRVLQHLALRDPVEGVIRGVPRERFGPVVLSRPWDLVSPAKGGKVFDALLASGLAVRVIDRTIDRATDRPNGRLDFDSDFDSDSDSKTASDVIATAKAVASPETPAKATAPQGKPCSCADGKFQDGSFCRSCQPGRDRLRAYKRQRDAERESQARAAAASSRGRSEPESIGSILGRLSPPRAAS